ncbi:hypothetical protein EV639_1101 [Rathayibacter tanaceti]|uniref:Uncharacterized protein n=2 Tax=Rathayibacter tanaceti TaxID=1671680 RepID=A0ACD2XH70_9MICO|nr:hypothetical protein ACH61_02954 [Rathayibacter tanaceti]TCO34849.1 hypothetical protein EV639_1101 [Rathayibacter tanaceti]
MAVVSMMSETDDRLGGDERKTAVTTVVRRIKDVTQPRGGYINPKSMAMIQLDDGRPSPLDHKVENIHASLVGMAVDYLTRLATGADPQEAFAISIRGAASIGRAELATAEAEVASLVAGKVDSYAILSACKLAGYDVGYRVGPTMYNPDARTKPDRITTDHIAAMVERSLAFFRSYGPVTLGGFTFPGGYSDVVTAGDGDFLTTDTLWDFKVSVSGPTKDHTLQVLMYLLMGLRSGQPEFESVTHLGVFNPRLNTVYRIALADVPADVVATVSRDVIGY